MLCAKSGWNWSSASGEEDEYMKSVYDNDDDDNYDDDNEDGQRTNFDQKSSLKSSAQIR